MPLYTTEMDWKQRNPNVTVLQSWTFVMVPETASSVFFMHSDKLPYNQNFSDQRGAHEHQSYIS